MNKKLPKNVIVIKNFDSDTQLPELFSLKESSPSPFKLNIPRSDNILVCPEESDFNTLAKFFMDVWFEKVNFILGFIV
jgi:hypothetical protein